MTGKFLLSLVVMLCTMGLFAVAANPCVHDGQEYEHRSAVLIDGKCLVCHDGEWQTLPYAPPAERCTGKL